jgi:hypothetical protein
MIQFIWSIAVKFNSDKTFRFRYQLIISVLEQDANSLLKSYAIGIGK